jgi:hypothetical protein
MKKGLILVVWFVVFMALLTGSLSLISAPNTIKNLIGVVVLAGTVTLSIETKCLTNLTIRRKHEE